MTCKVWIAACCLTLNGATAAMAADGPLGIDHRLSFDEQGIWNRSNQLAVRNLSAAAVIAGAAWEGSETRLGRTFWKSAEAMLIANASAELLKRSTGRPRPRQGEPDQWFQSGPYRSFPSGEVTHITAVVTPFIAEYGREQPLVWALAALPAYVGTARLKSQAHWQTDVLGGAALGAALGYYEYSRTSAWAVTVLPRGVTVGLKTAF